MQGLLNNKLILIMNFKIEIDDQVEKLYKEVQFMLLLSFFEYEYYCKCKNIKTTFLSWIYHFEHFFKPYYHKKRR